MATLTGQRVQDTYKDLLQVSNSNSGIDGTLRAISDGEGTTSAVSISSDALSVDNITINGNAITASSGALTISPAAGSALNLDDSNFTVDGGVVAITGSLAVDNVTINGNVISTTDTNGDLTLTPDGTGTVVVSTDLDVDNIGGS